MRACRNEGSATAPERGRFSYMGSRGGALWQRVVFRLSRVDGGSRARLAVEDALGRVEEREGSFFDHLEAELRRFRLPTADKSLAALPFDFLGGFVGYIGYEMKVDPKIRQLIRHINPHSQGRRCRRRREEGRQSDGQSSP